MASSNESMMRRSLTLSFRHHGATGRNALGKSHPPLFLRAFGDGLAALTAGRLSTSCLQDGGSGTHGDRLTHQKASSEYTRGRIPSWAVARLRSRPASGPVQSHSLAFVKLLPSLRTVRRGALQGDTNHRVQAAGLPNRDGARFVKKIL